MEQEQLRHQYLEALGITSWLPCAQLPGAAKSSAWLDDFRYPAPDIPFTSDRAGSARAALAQVQTQDKTQAAVAKVNTAQSERGISAARDALSSSAPVAPPARATETVALEQEPLDAPQQTSAPVWQEPPNFKLVFQRVGDLLLVDSLPPKGGVFSSNYQQLAQAIAHNLGGNGEMREPFMLPWPMFASKTLDQGPQQAAIAVQHKLGKELQAAPTKAVLLLGEAAAQMLLDRTESLDQLRGILFSIRADMKAIASYSLTEAMQLPGIKKQIWQDLQPLLKHLTQN